MNLEFKLSNRNAVLKELKREGNRITLSVGEVIYEVDLVKVKSHMYSVLYQGKSFNVEVFEKMEPKHYAIRTANSDFEVEVLDIESRYMQNRNQAGEIAGDSIIRAPMPGKVVRVLVQTGDQVEAGQTMVILSAMKMESEFKTGKSGIVTEVGVREGDTVERNQVMVVIEEVGLEDEQRYEL